MRSHRTHRFLIQGFVALLLVNVVQPTTPIKNNADLARSSGRIIDGFEATGGQFPHQVSLRYTATGKHFCGGSIIAAEWILTAAHCLIDEQGGLIEPSRITIVAGDLWLNKSSPTHQMSPGSEIMRHDDYDYATYENDIALVRLQLPFALEDPAVQCGIIRTSPVAVDTTCQLAGWGYHEYGYDRTDISNELRYVDVPIMDQPLCRKIHIQDSDIPEGMICAGDGKTFRDACETEGDSGGGLICDDILTGIASWGLDCFPNHPGVYTDIRYYQNWISERVRNVSLQGEAEDSGAGNAKFSLWMQLLSFALVGLVRRS